MTNKPPLDAVAALRPTVPEILAQPEKARRLEPDTMGAMAAAVVGAACVLASSTLLIALYVAPAGVAAVVAASVGAGLLVTVLTAGAVWAWAGDRRGRVPAPSGSAQTELSLSGGGRKH
ncbi:hypothetical protein [Leifsonia sp. SIMBA_070]|uniref:hypothetical protein n=1 Tax=Leifsonia sp. SIMBA_070 TaxID=3085810 RepID=UPI00397A1EC6